MRLLQAVHAALRWRSELRVYPGKTIRAVRPPLSGSPIVIDLPGLALSPPSTTSRWLRRSDARRWRCAMGPLLAFALLLAPGSFAQISATLSGTVTDPSGGAVVGAAVTVRNLETEAVRTTATGGSGRYEVLALPIGQYQVRVAKPGFAEGVRTGIRLTVDQDASVDVTLRLGSVSQQITVNSDAPFVSLTTANVSGLVGEQEIKNLPLNGRSYDLLLPLNPGIVNFT